MSPNESPSSPNKALQPTLGLDYCAATRGDAGPPRLNLVFGDSHL
jgi:hypothetical protein